MRLARNLTLVAIAAIAAMAFAASSASATPVEVVDNAGVHCSAVVVDGSGNVSGGCPVHVVSVGNVELFGHFFGFEVHEATCMNEFTVNFGENGSGKVSGYRIFTGAGSDANCDTLVTMCNKPWNVGAGNETAAGVVSGVVTVCISNTETGQCAGNISMNITHTGEAYTTTITDQRIGNTICEVTGTYANEANTIHVNHVH